MVVRHIAAAGACAPAISDERAERARSSAAARPNGDSR
jgi:hypothetical protein